MFTLSTKKYHHGNLRKALIDTGLEVIAEQGVRALTLREIARRLGVSRMAPYRHFADKSALLAAISTVGFEKFLAALEQAIHSSGDDFLSQADALALAYVQFALENRAHFDVMFGGGGEPQYLDEEGKIVAASSFQLLENLVRRGQDQNLIVPGETNHIARIIWAMVHGISILRLGLNPSNGNLDREFVLYCAHLLRTGLLPRPRQNQAVAY